MERIKQFVIGLALVSLIAAAGSIALDNLESDVRQDHITTVSNESLTASGGAAQATEGGLFISASALRNATSVTMTVGGDYNVSTSGAVTIAGNYSQSGTYYIDYTHYEKTHMMNISTAGLTGIENTTNYFDTAGTIAGVALLLTIVIGAFYFVTRR